MGMARGPLIPDTDMLQPTTTARRSPRRLATTSPLSLLSSPRSPSLTPSQSRPASTNPSSSPESLALTSLRTNASPSQRSRIPVSLSRSVLLDLEPPPARLSSLPSPSRSARNSLTDMPLMSIPMSPPPLMPTPLPLTMVNHLLSHTPGKKNTSQGTSIRMNTAEDKMAILAYI